MGTLLFFNSVDTPNPREYFGFNNAEDSEMMAHYNTDGVLCPHCQSILHYKSITYATSENTIVQNVISNVLNWIMQSLH